MNINVETLVWSATSGLILIMMGIIGTLVKTGFDGLRKELKAIWDKLDRHQEREEANSRSIVKLEGRIETVERICSERACHS